MNIYVILIKFIIGLFDDFKDFVINKPILTVLFPASGFGSLYIPDDLVQVPSNGVLRLIDLLTPYLKFVFLILTLILTVVSLVLQIRKLRHKDKN